MDFGTVIGGEVQDLEGDLARQQRVFGQVDRTHPACTERLDDAIAAELRRHGDRRGHERGLQVRLGK